MLGSKMLTYGIISVFFLPFVCHMGLARVSKCAFSCYFLSHPFFSFFVVDALILFDCDLVFAGDSGWL